MSTVGEVAAAIRKLAPKTVVAFTGAGGYCRGVTVDINPQASALSTGCTFAIAETAAVATPPLVDAIEESPRCSR